MNILIVDSDDDEKFLLVTAFKHKGYSGRLHFVNDGADMMSYLENCTEEDYPGLILIDLDLPGRKNMGIIYEVKQSDLFKRIPIIVFTAPKGEKYFLKCYELGANTCIVKPSTFDKLLNVVQQVYSYWMYTATIV
jgi:DNA-binding response OmpR family regulator